MLSRRGAALSGRRQPTPLRHPGLRPRQYGTFVDRYADVPVRILNHLNRQPNELFVGCPENREILCIERGQRTCCE